MDINKIYEGDCLEVLKTFDNNSIDCCITSPPYFGLRDYGHSEQIGLEETPELFVAKMVEVFTEVKRVLKNEGTLWLNLGDSYWGGKGQSGQGDAERQAGRAERGESINQEYQQMGGKGYTRPADRKHSVIKPKDLIGIPWIVAFALRQSGWYLRQDIIWSKPNPMPESVTDRCTKAHEYIFLLSKSSKYYYDAESIMQEMADSSIERLNQNLELQDGSFRVPGKLNGAMKAVGRRHTNNKYTANNQFQNDKSKVTHSGLVEFFETGKANKRSVWTVTTRPYSESHFATFPERLITDMIKAGCPEGGLILDPFMGAGTTGLVARKLNRNYVGIELNPAYIKIANKRLEKELGMFI